MKNRLAKRGSLAARGILAKVQDFLVILERPQEKTAQSLVRFYQEDQC